MIEIKTLALSAIAALLMGAGSGYFFGLQHATTVCNAARWQAEATTLRATLITRDAVALVDREIARDAADAASETAKEYAQLRRDYAALKKARAAQKNDAPESRSLVLIPPPDATTHNTFGEFNHESIFRAADDLPLSDNLFRLYIASFRPLLRSSAGVGAAGV